MRRHVFRVQRQRLLERPGGQIQEFLLPFRMAALHLGALEIGLAEFVDDLVILAEVETALVEFGITVFQDAAELGDGLVEKTVLLVHQSVEPGDGPPGRGRVELGGALQRGHGVVQPAFLEINPRQIHRAVGVAEFLDVLEGFGRLDQLAFFGPDAALQQEADAVIVPALPFGDGWRVCAVEGRPAAPAPRPRTFNRESDFVRRDGDDGQVVGHGERRAEDVVGVEHVIHVERVELAVLQFHLDGQRPVLVFRHRQIRNAPPGPRRAESGGCRAG